MRYCTASRPTLSLVLCYRPMISTFDGRCMLTVIPINIDENHTRPVTANHHYCLNIPTYINL